MAYVVFQGWHYRRQTSGDSGTESLGLDDSTVSINGQANGGNPPISPVTMQDVIFEESEEDVASTNQNNEREYKRRASERVDHVESYQLSPKKEAWKGFGTVEEDKTKPLCQDLDDDDVFVHNLDQVLSVNNLDKSCDYALVSPGGVLTPKHENVNFADFAREHSPPEPSNREYVNMPTGMPPSEEMQRGRRKPQRKLTSSSNSLGDLNCDNNREHEYVSDNVLNLANQERGLGRLAARPEYGSDSGSGSPKVPFDNQVRPRPKQLVRKAQNDIPGGYVSQEALNGSLHQDASDNCSEGGGNAAAAAVDLAQPTLLPFPIPQPRFDIISLPNSNSVDCIVPQPVQSASGGSPGYVSQPDLGVAMELQGNKSMGSMPPPQPYVSLPPLGSMPNMSRPETSVSGTRPYVPHPVPSSHGSHPEPTTGMVGGSTGANDNNSAPAPQSPSYVAHDNVAGVSGSFVAEKTKPVDSSHNAVESTAFTHAPGGYVGLSDVVSQNSHASAKPVSSAPEYLAHNHVASMDNVNGSVKNSGSRPDDGCLGKQAPVNKAGLIPADDLLFGAGHFIDDEQSLRDSAEGGSAAAAAAAENDGARDSAAAASVPSSGYVAYNDVVSPVAAATNAEKTAEVEGSGQGLVPNGGAGNGTVGSNVSSEYVAVEELEHLWVSELTPAVTHCWWFS